MKQPILSKTRTPKRKAKIEDKPRKLGRPTLPHNTIDLMPINRRLGYRVGEYAKMLGISYVSVWRSVKSGKIRTVTVGGVKLIPRAVAIEQGLINKDDSI
jgi:hypothetical protein